LPLNEADMEECQRNLDKLSESDRLLFRLLASTGMRLSEAFEIDKEEKEKKLPVRHRRQEDRTVMAPRAITGQRAPVRAEEDYRTAVFEQAGGPGGHGIEASQSLLE